MKSHFDRIGRTITVQKAKRQCLDKKPFPSRNAARDKAARRALAYPDEPHQHPYRCTVCGGWHLTSRPKNQHSQGTA